MTIRPSVVLARLAHLGDVLVHLARLRSMQPAQRTADPIHRLAAERALHVAAEAIFDIGHHLLAGRGRPIPATYRDVIPALVREGTLSAELGTRLDGLAGFRNLLVHDYTDVDPVKIWEIVDERLDDLREVHQALASIPELTVRG